MKLHRFRPGQGAAFHVGMDRIECGCSHTCIVLPTRYGKVILICCLAYAAKEAGLISGAIVLSPYQNLTEQFLRRDYLQRMALWFDLDMSKAMKIEQLTRFSALDPFSNGAYLLAANMQLMLRGNIEQFLDLVDHERSRTGLPLALFIDECHFVSEKKRWGRFLTKAAESGVLIILLTATPIRDDGDAIPGFEPATLSSQEKKRYFVFDMGDDKHNCVEVWKGKQSVTKLKAHHETTFRQAWNEKPSPLCHLSREIMDAEFLLDGDPKPIKLSDLSASRAREALGKAIRDDGFIEAGVRKALEGLAHMQAVNPKCATIVFVGNDLPGTDSDNAHAKSVKAWFDRLGTKYLGRQPECHIVTMKSDDDVAAAKKLESFAGHEGRDGRGDVLIVKQMGGVGFDCPRLKVLLDLSSVRTVSASVQRWMRVATPFEGIQVGIVITTADEPTNNLWAALITEQGGDLAEQSLWVPDSLLDAYAVEKIERDERALRVGDSLLSGYDDSHGNIGDLDLYGPTNALLGQFPELLSHYTKPEISQRVALLGMPLGTNPPERISRTNEEHKNELRAKILSAVKSRIKITPAKYAQDRKLYGQAISDLWTRAYIACGVPKGVNLGEIVNLDTLARLHDFIAAQPEMSFS